MAKLLSETRCRPRIDAAARPDGRGVGCSNFRIGEHELCWANSQGRATTSNPPILKFEHPTPVLGSVALPHLPRRAVPAVLVPAGIVVVVMADPRCDALFELDDLEPGLFFCSVPARGGCFLCFVRFVNH